MKLSAPLLLRYFLYCLTTGAVLARVGNHRLARRHSGHWMCLCISCITLRYQPGTLYASGCLRKAGHGASRDETCEYK